MFGLGQRGFAVLGQAFESLGQIVAPEEEGQDNGNFKPTTSPRIEEVDSEEENDFDSQMRKFIENRRDQLVDESLKPTQEPASPASSLVDVTLDDDSAHPTEPPTQLAVFSPHLSVISSSSSPPSPPASLSSSVTNQTVFLPSQQQSDLERRIQQKYRLEMEQELRAFDERYREMQQQSDHTVNVLQFECEKWRRKAMEANQQLERSPPPSQACTARDESLIEELRGKCTSLQNQLGEAEEEMEALASTNRSLSGMVAELEKFTAELGAAQRETEEKLKNAENNCNLLNIEKESLRADLLAAQAQLDERSVQLQNKMSELECMARDLEQASSQSLKEMEMAEHQACVQEQELQRLRDEAQDFLRRVTDSEATNTALQTALEDQHTTTNNLRNDLAQSNERLRMVESEAQRWKSMVENTSTVEQREVVALHSECDELRSAIATLNNNLQQLVRERDRLNAALQQSEEHLKEVEEVAWKSKAYEAELLYALDMERADTDKLRNAIQSLQDERRKGSVESEALQSSLVQCLQLILKSNETLDDKTLAYFSEELRSNLRDVHAAMHQRDSQLRDVRDVLAETLVAGDDSSSALSAATAVVARNKEFRVMAEELQRNLQLVIQLDADKEKKLVDVQAQLASSSQGFAKTKEELDRVKVSNQQVHEQLRETKAQVSRLEQDNKNLQIVISQMRNAGKAKSGEVDSAQQELLQLRAHNSHLIKELEELKRSLKQFENHDEILSDLDRVVKENHVLEETISGMRLNQALIEKKLYAKSTATDILQSELKMLKQDLSQRVEEVNNLQDAMKQMQMDHRFEINHYKSLVLEAQQQHSAALEEKFQQQVQQFQEKIAVVEIEKKKLQEQCEDQVMLRRQVELSFHQEKKKLQQTLEQVVQQMNNSTNNVVDKALIANLIVSYFQRRRSLEVLQLISKVLCFNDEQLVIVGLKVPPLNFFNSIFSTVLGPANPVPVEGDNLAEMWVNYLMHQAEEGDCSTNKAASGQANTKPTPNS